MSTIDKNQLRGDRILTYGDVHGDGGTAATSLKNELLEFNNLLTTIDSYGDIKHTKLSKLDHWDDLTDLTDPTVAVEMYYQGRTVVYTGNNNGWYRQGYMYKVEPDLGCTWINISHGSEFDVLRVNDKVPDATLSGEAYIDIKQADGTFIARFYHDSSDSTIKLIYPNMSKPITAFTYNAVTKTWGRSESCQEFLLFVGAHAEVQDPALNLFFLKHLPSSDGTNRPMIWETMTRTIKVPMYPYDTVAPDDNTCYLYPSSTCFFFGKLSRETSTFSVNLNTDALQSKLYYANNCIIVTTEGPVNLNITATYDGNDRKVYVSGDKMDTADTYRINIEVLPDGKVLAIVKNQTGASKDSEVVGSAYIYGFRYNLSSTSPSVNRIELHRYVSDTGDVTEEIVTVPAYTSMPCHNWRRCVMKGGKSAPEYFLYKNNSAYKEDGKIPANLTGDDGDVVVQMPKTYLRITRPVAGPLTATPAANDGYQYRGYIDYLVSTEPIPDPPKDSNGNFTTCYCMEFNDVHPLFRVDGEIELDGLGNYQYEKRFLYDGSVSTMTAVQYPARSFYNTGIYLRKPKDYVYGAAFASTYAYNGIKQTDVTTLKATASSAGTTVSCTGSFVDNAAYPQRHAGLAGYNGGMYRSIAPYKDGEMVGVTIPGVKVNVGTSDVHYPSLMPGGCSLVFHADGENADQSITPNTSFEYTATMSFEQEDGSTVYKDYHLKFNENTVPGIGVSSCWTLTDGDDLIAHSNTIQAASFNSFNDLIWAIDNTHAGVDITMTTKNAPYKVKIGPLNYGNRNRTICPTGSQTTWDSAIANNPNWALNYRPAVSITRTAFNDGHRAAMDEGVVNGHTVPIPAYQDSDLILTQSEFCWKNKIIQFPDGKPETKFYWSPDSPAHILVDSVMYRIRDYIGEDRKNNFTIRFRIDGDDLLSYVFTFKGGHRLKRYWEYANATYGYYRLEYITANDSRPYKDSTIGKLYPNTWRVNKYADSTFTTIVWSVYQKCRVIDKNNYNPAFKYYPKDKYGNIDYTMWYLSGILYKNGVEIARYDSDIFNAYTDTSAQYWRDSDRRYMQLQNVGFRNISSGSVVDTDVSEDLEVPFVGSKTSADYRNRVWTRTDKDGYHKLIKFDQKTLRWNVVKDDENQTAIYSSEPLDPAAFTFTNSSSNNGRYFQGRVTQGTQYLIPGVVNGQTTLTFTSQNVEDRNTNLTSAILENYPNTIIRLATETNAISGKVYYKRTGTEGNYTYTKTVYGNDQWAVDITGTPHYVIYTPVFDRVYTSGVYREEYIKPTDTRVLSDGNPITYKYSNCWVVLKYTDNTYTTPDTVVASEYDVIQHHDTVHAVSRGLYQPLNMEAHNNQRYYDPNTGALVNNTLVYRFESNDWSATTPTMMSAAGNITGKYKLLMYIDETGQLPAYINGKSDMVGYALTTDTTFQSDKSYYTRSGSGTVASPYVFTLQTVTPGAAVPANTYFEHIDGRDTIRTSTASLKDRWVIIWFKDKNFTELNYPTVINNTDGSMSNTPPSLVRLTYTPRYGSPDQDVSLGLYIENCKILQTSSQSRRAYNCHTRLKQFFCLMMVIDGATFNTQSGISTGKSWLGSFDYSRSTFNGRTVELGNNNGEVLWDPDIDLNIDLTNWSADAQKKTALRVVAFNWRGYENPFGNIGEYEDGIIPCTKFLYGTEVAGYNECIMPGAYSDSMNLTRSYMCNNIANAPNPVDHTYREYSPGSSYSWNVHLFPASGWIRRWDPVTFLPTRAGGTASASTYCCDRVWVYGRNAIYDYEAEVHRGVYPYTLNKYALLTLILWKDTGNYVKSGTRLQF